MRRAFLVFHERPWIAFGRVQFFLIVWNLLVLGALLGALIERMVRGG